MLGNYTLALVLGLFSFNLLANPICRSIQMGDQSSIECRYEVQNTTVDNLRDRIWSRYRDFFSDLFRTDLRTDPGTSNILLIVHHDDAFIEKLIEELPFIDYQAPVSNFEELKIVAQIYAVTEEKVTDFNMRLDQLILEGFKLAGTTGAGAVGNYINAGWGDIAGFIGLERIKRNIEYMDTIEFYAREHSYFQDGGTRYKFNTWFVPEGDVLGAKKQSVGISISGFFRFNPADRNFIEFPIVRFIWSKQDEGNINQIPEFNTLRQHVQTPLGVPVKLMSVSSVKLFNQSDLGLLKTGKLKGFEKKRIVALLSAYSTKPSDTKAVRPLTDTQRQELPDSGPEFRKIFEKVQLKAKRDQNGQTSLYVQLDQNSLAKNNLDRLVKIELLSDELTGNKVHRWTLEDLSLNPKQIYSFEMDNLSKTYYEMKLKFSVEGKRGKKNRYKMKTFYNAQSAQKNAFGRR